MAKVLRPMLPTESPTAKDHARSRISMCWRKALISAFAVDVEASCGGSLRARSAYPRGLCRRAPRIPLAAPDGGPACSPVTHPSGHQRPGSPPQPIAELCPLPTRIGLSYLTDLARVIAAWRGWGVIAHKGAGRLRPRGRCRGLHRRRGVVTYLKVRCAPGPGSGQADRLPLPWFLPPAGAGRSATQRERRGRA